MSTSIVTETMPFWQQHPCAQWGCTVTHKDNDHVDDRGHASADLATIMLTREKLPVEDLISAPFMPPAAVVLVERNDSEAAARVIVLKNDAQILNVTQAEASQLIEALQAAIALVPAASIAA
jgi:hypothetical protein